MHPTTHPSIRCWVRGLLLLALSAPEPTARAASCATSLGFPQKASFATNSGPYSVALGDLNGDGKLDALSPCYGLAWYVEELAGTVEESDATNNQFHLGNLAVTGNNPAQLSLPPLQNERNQ